MPETKWETAPMLPEIIQVYNYKRPHMSIDMITPAAAHLLEGELSRTWKTYYQKGKAHQQKAVDLVKLNQDE